jgi:hypothetical protein
MVLIRQQSARPKAIDAMARICARICKPEQVQSEFSELLNLAMAIDSKTSFSRIETIKSIINATENLSDKKHTKHLLTEIFTRVKDLDTAILNRT